MLFDMLSKFYSPFAARICFAILSITAFPIQNRPKKLSQFSTMSIHPNTSPRGVHGPYINKLWLLLRFPHLSVTACLNSVTLSGKIFRRLREQQRKGGLCSFSWLLRLWLLGSSTGTAGIARTRVVLVVAERMARSFPKRLLNKHCPSWFSELCQRRRKECSL